MNKNDMIRAEERGFTLVEIVAVVVIMGILAALAVPRYMSVTADARNSAAVAAVAEGKARVSQMAGKYLLNNSGNRPAASDLNTGIYVFGTSTGDYVLSYGTSGTTGISITATGRSGGPAAGGTATAVAVLPTP